MGCRCCKIIQSYIFDPQEVHTAGYINEINNYKSDSQDGGKFKGKHNVEIQVHKNELQNAELQPSMNRNKLNNTKDVVRNHRNTALQEEGLNNSCEKSNVHINGVHSYSNLKSNHTTNQNKEVSRHGCSAQLPICPARGLSQPKEGCDTNLEADHTKLPLGATESSQYRQLLTTRENCIVDPSAGLKDQSNDMGSPDPDLAGSESLSDNCERSTQSTDPTILTKHGDQEGCEAKRCNSGDPSCRIGTLNGTLKDEIVNNICCLRPKPEASPKGEQVGYGEVNGEFEEEDADVAEALAALAAATAGEDFEEEEEEEY